MATPSSGAADADTAYLVSLIPTISLIASFIFTVTFHRRAIGSVFQTLTTRLQQHCQQQQSGWNLPIRRLQQHNRLANGPTLLPQDENDAESTSISSLELELEEEDTSSSSINEYSFSELFAHSRSKPRSKSNSNSDLDLDVDLDMSLNSSFDTTDSDHQASQSQSQSQSQSEEESGSVLLSRRDTTTSSMDGENEHFAQNMTNKQRNAQLATNSSASMEASLAKYFGARTSLSRGELVEATAACGDGTGTGTGTGTARVEKLQEQRQAQLGDGTVDSRQGWWWDRLLDSAVRRFQRSVGVDGAFDGEKQKEDGKSAVEVENGDDVQ